MTDTYIFYDEEEDLMLNVYEHKDGGICPYFILKGKVFKQAAAYISMKKDLYECVVSIKYLMSINDNANIPQIAKSSLLFSSIMKYAKCFTSGEGRGTSLNFNAIFKGDGQEHFDFHNQTMDLRHSYLAHAGNSAHESRALMAILSPDYDNKTIETIIYAGFRLKDDDSHLDNYLKLYEYVKSKVDEKTEALQEIVNQKAEEIDIEEMYNKSKLPPEEKLIPFKVDQFE